MTITHRGTINDLRGQLYKTVILLRRRGLYTKVNLFGIRGHLKMNNTRTMGTLILITSRGSVTTFLHRRTSGFVLCLKHVLQLVSTRVLMPFTRHHHGHKHATRSLRHGTRLIIMIRFIHNLRHLLMITMRIKRVPGINFRFIRFYINRTRVFGMNSNHTRVLSHTLNKMLIIYILP